MGRVLAVRLEFRLVVSASGALGFVCGRLSCKKLTSARLQLKFLDSLGTWTQTRNAPFGDGALVMP